MIDNPTHKLDVYHDDRQMVAFCKLCSAEGEFLTQPCPGKFIPNRDRMASKDIDKDREHK